MRRVELHKREGLSLSLSLSSREREIVNYLIVERHTQPKKERKGKSYVGHDALPLRERRELDVCGDVFFWVNSHTSSM
jgi:hypothetical protein